MPKIGYTIECGGWIYTFKSTGWSKRLAGTSLPDKFILGGEVVYLLNHITNLEEE